MYVRPEFRGDGLGRALLQRLLSEARAIGYQCVRLETAVFMTEAHGLYRSLGFHSIPMLEHSETALSGLQEHAYFMELPLTRAAAC
ncbi:hypothetical protein VV02_10400 [Luteipulveratus mongoliensis]|uniref:N-acetyltransferase domain-containing protein n=2 Tax=Luteipulveratus mongoliensis TaxID=571913 RepID=A0A0K1JQE5_9MICO|nr:hypothetical protein VV02_10400 [Luteipulveratus mongoliensis]